MKIQLKLKIAIFTILGLFTKVNAQGNIDGFFSEIGALSVTGSYSSSTFKEFYQGETLNNSIPGYNEISQDIYDLYVKYEAATDLVAFVNIPYIIGQGDLTSENSNGLAEVSGFQDIALGLKYRFHKFKYETSNLSLIGGLTVTLPGDYDPSGVLSIGSGAMSADFTGGLHYQFDNGLFGTTFASYSFKDDAQDNGDYNIPNAVLASVKLGYANSSFYVDAWLDYISSVDGVDIGGEGFTGNFPETKVMQTRVGGTLSKKIGDSGFAASLGINSLIDGRNTGKSTTFSAGITYEIELL